MSSDPPLTRTPLNILDHHHHQPLLPLSSAAAASGGLSAPSPSSTVLPREYRKGNWTVHETLILITAKRLDDDRRTRSGATTSSEEPSAAPRSAEQRWKWVENYCWKHGCLRSQNQCNDKWDNLLRDYKKVRDYESRAATSSAAAAPSSYWSLERHERKERNLPTNLAFEVYEALTDVLSRRATLRGGGSSTAAAPHSRPLPLPPPLPPPPPPPQQASVSGEMTPEGSSETEGSGGDGDGSPSPPPPPSGGKRRRGLGSSVVRGAAELARTLMACEERKERRHRDLMELEERRLRMEENRTEMNRQAVAGLIAAVNGLSAAIHSLVADHRSGHGR
ncbi:uncharacterized protein LOC110034753 [Phalaenopsis equestris]|uniref:uncharacterized protein LOC110034753 n=1 Tax=Phalaenopsis equestris TaxID=78828 RepID=UPI0009E4A0F2|nr:uncharacterized protein LOC110034753 [Phalaenopsis equestris]